MDTASFLIKAALDYAAGLPSKDEFGQPETIPLNKVLPFVIQRHLAQRAGPHYDVRFGGGPKDKELFSWATKHGLPEPGEKRMLYQQPLHRGTYANFQGALKGYGAGTVKTHDKGTVFVTKATPDKINVIVAHKKNPEYYTFLRQTSKNKNKPWLVLNTTPTSAYKLLGGSAEEIGLNKPKYKSLQANEIDKVLNPGHRIQEKIDGASILYKVMKNKIEALSYRESKTGKPIIHTQRLFGPGGAKPKDLPPGLENTILRGEAYATRGNKAIPPQQLGGVLNASLARSIELQKALKLKMKNSIFNVVRLGNKPVGDMPADERRNKLKEILQHLPESFNLPREAASPEEGRKMWEDIIGNKNPITQEGIVAWPTSGGTPIKVKARPDSDVFVRNIFPGENKYRGVGAGGFDYSLTPDGAVVGRVGTGLSDELRRQLFEDPSRFVGRRARITSQGQYPSGAHRAPALIALHEDY